MGFSKFNHVKISAIAGVVPENYINIDDEIEYYNNDPKKLERNKKILGLGKRHIVDEGVGNIELAEQTIINLEKKCKMNINDIDVLAFASSGHDYAYPASACIMHGKLDLPESVSCFDFSGLACSGYVYHLWNLFSMIEAGTVKKCLLISSDIGSTHTNTKNRNVCILFGDGAVATLIEHTNNIEPSYFYTGTNGKGWKNIVAPARGFKLPVKKDIADLKILDNAGNEWYMWEAILKGFDIFKYTSIIGPKGINDILNFAHLEKKDIDYFAIHQANKQIVDTIARHSGIQENKYSTETFTKYGNCGISSTPMNICDILENKKVNNVMLATFGGGLSFGFSILNLSKTVNGGIEYYKTPTNFPTRQEQIDYWIKYYKGEINE